MAKKKDDTIVDVAQAYSKTESFFNENGKTIMIAVGVALLAAVGYALLKNFIWEPKSADASNNVWKAEYYSMQNMDSLALNGDGDYYGFYDVAEEYSGTESADIANYEIGVKFLQDEEFEDAIEYLSKASFDDEILESIRLGAIGDANIELGNFEEGIQQYEKAISNSKNEATAPLYLFKKGLCCEELEDLECALSAYNRIKIDFHNSVEGRSIAKYIARVEARMAS